MWAQNEVGAMVAKAARGAGFPVGQAEDLGRVAVYLAASGGDCRLISAALQEEPAPVDVNWGTEAISVNAGPAILIGPIVCDAFALGCTRAKLADAEQVLLICAYLAQAGIAATVQGAEVMRDAQGLEPGAPGPVEIADEDWAIWADLAARTYVPESDASRAAGAGAGLTDND